MQQGFFRASSSPSKQGAQLSLPFSPWKHTFSFLASSLYGPLVSILAFASLSTSAAYPDSGLETDIALMKISLSGIQRNSDDISTHSASIDSKLSSELLKLDDLIDGEGYILQAIGRVEAKGDTANNFLYDINLTGYRNNVLLSDISNSAHWISTNLSALSTLPVSVSNAIVAAFQNGVGANIWEPFWAWTNVLLQFAINTSDRNIESHFSDWMDPNGYYVFPGMFGGGNYEADWIPSFPSFVSVTLGGLYDNTDLGAYGYDWDWQYLFNGKTQGLHDDPTYSNWFWWMSEGVRRQLNVQTNIWASSLENGNRLSALTNALITLRDYFVTNDALATSPLVSSDVSNAVLNAGEYLPSTEDYYSEEQAETNSWLSLGFVVSVDATEPTVNQSSITENSVSGKLNANSTWTANGVGLFRLTNPSFQSDLRLITGVQNCPDGTIEKDVGQDFQILAWIGNSLTNFYDLFYFLFCLFCIYREVRFYTSDGKVQ